MKRVSFAVILILALFAVTDTASALSRWGKINGTYSYDDLKIKKGSGHCTMSGVIKNNSGKMREGVFIKFYAYDISGNLLWSDIIHILTIPARGKQKFEEYVNGCSEPNPYKIKFKVTD